jgi:acetylornithine deacetylase/succinyl-diaminopimelate desuccinylase-like protein
MACSEKQKVLEQLEHCFDEYLEDIRIAIRQPSVSKTGQGIPEMAQITAGYLRELGVEVSILPGTISPIVSGYLAPKPNQKTLLLYELYDVQPADEEGWHSPPFDAEIKDVDGHASIIGRGAFNSKGPLFGFLSVLKAFRQAGVEIPVGFRFVIEGEEEVGSPSLEPFIRGNQEKLAACDAAFIPYLGTNKTDLTVIRLGFKGIVFISLSVKGGLWGGPSEHDIHPLNASWLASPAWELVQALACLQNREGCLCVEGIDLEPPISREDQELLRDLARGFNPKQWLKAMGAKRFKSDLDHETLLYRYMFEPTLNIDQLVIGHDLPGQLPPTVMHHQAKAFVDLRLVPGMDVDTTIRQVREHLNRSGFEHIDLKVLSAYPAAKCSLEEPVVHSLIKACQAHAARLEVFPMHPGAAPMYLFDQVLGIPFAFGGVGHGGRSHISNEYITLEGLRLFQKSMVDFLFEFGRK